MTYRYASALSPAGTFAPFAPLARLVALELIEAAITLGRGGAAAAHLAAVRRAGIAGWSPRWALLAAGATVLVSADGPSATDLDALLADVAMST